MKDFIQSLAQATEMVEHYAFIDSTAVQEPSVLVTIFKALPKDWIKLLNSWQQRAAYSRILEAVCLTKGKAQIEAAIAIAEQLERPKDVDRVAAFLVSKQDQHTLLEILLKSQSKRSKELLALVIHELVAHGIDLRKSPHHSVLERVNQESAFKNLTLYPFECEHENTFPVFGIGSSSSSLDYTIGDASFASLNRNTVAEIIELSENNGIAIALLNWEEASNGTILGIRGKTAKKNTVEEIIGALKVFEEDTQLKLIAATNTQIFKSLFGAASKGGAYNSGIFAAKGRLLAWTTLNRMMHDAQFESCEQVHTRMNDHEWFRFTTNEWFNNEIWDFGVFCLSKNGTEFGLVAGTDVD